MSRRLLAASLRCAALLGCAPKAPDAAAPPTAAPPPSTVAARADGGLLLGDEAPPADSDGTSRSGDGCLGTAHCADGATRDGARHATTAAELTTVPPTPDRGPAMVPIPEGSFWMGSDDGEPDERPAHEVTVRAFELDLTEVTVAQYRICVTMGACPAPRSGDLCNFGPYGKDDHPVNCVDWFEAAAYCQWASKRLPTEAEWEYAARGREGRAYPWGDAAPARQLCWNRWDSRAGTCPVGRYPQRESPFRVEGLAGNVSEWTSTQYCESYSPTAHCEDARVYRGGSWTCGVPWVVRATFRSALGPRFRGVDLGFRCARS
jgi:sulfatase modifying factor 1